MSTINQTTETDIIVPIHDEAHDIAAREREAAMPMRVAVIVGKGSDRRTVTVDSTHGYEGDCRTVRGYRGQARGELKLHNADASLAHDLTDAANEVAASHRAAQRLALRRSIHARLVGRNRLEAEAIVKHVNKMSLR